MFNCKHKLILILELEVILCNKMMKKKIKLKLITIIDQAQLNKKTINLLF